MPEKLKEDLYNYPNNPNPISPEYPLESILTEAHMQNTLTSDMVSIVAAKGKIPIGNPNDGYKLDSSWLGIDPDATYAVDATTTRKGIIEIATEAEAKTGTDTERAVTPAGVKASILQNTPTATTAQPGVVTLTNLIDNSQDKAVTPYAIQNYLSSSNFSKASYSGYGITKFASTTNVAKVLTDSATKPVNTLKNDTNYKEQAVDPYSLYNYVSNNTMYFNVNKQSVGGIIFRDLSEDDTATRVTATERARLYVNKDNGNTYLKVGSKTLTLLDIAGNTTVPTSVITPAIKNSSGDAPKLGTKQIGSASQPIYIASDGTITKCNTIDNVNNADRATKDGSGNVITSTYLPLAGGTMTGNINFSSGRMEFHTNDNDLSDTVTTHIIGRMGANDTWRIGSGATASDSGYLEIATADNAGEPIYVSQYKTGEFQTLTRRASILDASGNTDLPGDNIVHGMLRVEKPGDKYAKNTDIKVLSVKYKNAAGTFAYGGDIINCVGNDTGDSSTNEFPVSIGSSAGPTQIGSGESRKNFFKARNLHASENLYLTSDGTIVLYPGCYNDQSKYGGPMTITSAGVTTTGSKVNITGINTIDGKAANVTGTVAIANGGTGATDRLSALKNLTNQNVGTNATYFLTITGSWATGGYTSVANAKTVLGLSNYLPLAGGTMTGNITRSISSVTRGTAPSSTVYNSAYVRDSKNNAIGCIETKYATNKTSSTALYAYNTTAATGNNIGSIGIGCDTSGAVYTWAPTPASGDSSTKIATTAFVKTQGYATTTITNQKLGPFDYSKKVSIPKPSSGDDIYNPPSAGIVICSIGYGTIVIDSINYLDGVDFCSKHVRDTYTVPAQPGKPIKFTGRSWGYFIPCKV